MAYAAAARAGPSPFTPPRRTSTINSVSSGSSTMSIRVSTVAIGHCPKPECPKIPNQLFKATLHFSRRGNFHATPIKCDTCGDTIISIGSSSKVPPFIQPRPMHSRRNISSSMMHNITRSPMGQRSLPAALVLPSAQVLGAVGSPTMNAPNAMEASDETRGQDAFPQNGTSLQDRNIDTRDFAASSLHASFALPEPQLDRPSDNVNFRRNLGSIIKSRFKLPLKLRNVFMNVRTPKIATDTSSRQDQQLTQHLSAISAGKRPATAHPTQGGQDVVAEAGASEELSSSHSPPLVPIRRYSAPPATNCTGFPDHRCDCTGSCHCWELCYIRPDHRGQLGPYWAGYRFCPATPSEHSLLSSPRPTESTHAEDFFHVGRAFDKRERHRSLEVPQMNGCNVCRRSSSTSEAVSSTSDLILGVPPPRPSHLTGPDGPL